MNIEEIDKWLDNEYGCSYTRLEELHNYWFEKSTNQKLEIERLNNIINELEKWLEDYIKLFDKPDMLEEQTCEDLKEVLDKLQELRNENDKK